MANIGNIQNFRSVIWPSKEENNYLRKKKIEDKIEYSRKSILFMKRLSNLKLISIC